MRLLLAIVLCGMMAGTAWGGTCIPGAVKWSNQKTYTYCGAWEVHKLVPNSEPPESFKVYYDGAAGKRVECEQEIRIWRSPDGMAVHTIYPGNRVHCPQNQP